MQATEQVARICERGFQVEEIPSDTQMREILDACPRTLARCYPDVRADAARGMDDPVVTAVAGQKYYPTVLDGASISFDADSLSPLSAQRTATGRPTIPMWSSGPR